MLRPKQLHARYPINGPIDFCETPTSMGRFESTAKEKPLQNMGFQTGPGLQPISTDFVNESYFMQFSNLNSYAIRIENAINI